MKPTEIIAKINKERPLLGVKDSRAVLYRSKLVEYEKRYGKPYTVPKGYKVVEDVELDV